MNLAPASEVILVRVDVAPDGHAELRVKQTEFRTDGKKPKLIADLGRDMASDELTEFQRVFEASGFWRLILPVPKTASCVSGSVGIVEAVRGNQYHAVTVNCWNGPVMSSLFAEANKLLHSMR